MKVTIEYDNEQEAIQALNAGNWQQALWQLDQELRGIVKHGYIGHREAHDLEIETYDQCRKMLREAMEDNDITFDL
jgi:uncharacterized protein HemY